MEVSGSPLESIDPAAGTDGEAEGRDGTEPNQSTGDGVKPEGDTTPKPGPSSNDAAKCSTSRTAHD